MKLVESIEKNTKRYIDVFSQAVDAVLPKETKDVTYVTEITSVTSLMREHSFTDAMQFQGRCVGCDHVAT